MESTFQALGGIVLRSIPTIILVILLHFYLKRMFFAPLEETLRRRRKATEGAREAAEAAFRSASEKAAAYEAALNRARGEIYKEQEETRKRWLEDQSGFVEQARGRGRELIARAKTELAAEAESARKELGVSSGALASQIVRRVLAGGTN